MSTHHTLTSGAPELDETALPEIVSAQEWQTHRDALLVAEKELSKAHDALAARRRRLPMVEFRGDYAFHGDPGEITLLDLFDGRHQLAVYHFMQRDDGEFCEGCSTFTDTVSPHMLPHLHARDTSLAIVTRNPWEKIAPYRDRMGWTIPFASSHGTTFDADCDTVSGFGLSVFLRHHDRVFRTYFTRGRAVDAVGNHWSFLDLSPLGRQETWEDTPAGRPQTDPYLWWRRHDEY